MMDNEKSVEASAPLASEFDERPGFGTNRSFLKALFDGISEEIMVVDGNGIIQDVNEVFLQECAQKKSDVLGKRCYDIRRLSGIHCHITSSHCPLQKAKETGERVEVVYGYGSDEDGKMELTRMMYPVSTGEAPPTYFIEISRDVTEYRNLIRRLKASEKKFRTILDTATDAIISINSDHKIILFNNAAERIFGYSREEMLNKDLKVLIPPQYGDHYQFVSSFLTTMRLKAMGQTLSLTALKKGGKEFPIHLGLSYHQLENEITFTAIIRDVSQQKQLEKKLLQSERLAAVGQTVAHVAHELKNPLMIIGGFSNQIRNSLSDKKTVQKLDMILDEVSRLEKLVANLGDFTKVYNLVKRPTDIHSVIQDVIKIVKGIHWTDKYAFELDPAPELEEINCDPDKLKQVFINILTNGIEAMDDGGTIRITTEKWVNSVGIRVADEGSGILEEDLLHIFEPFYTTRDRGSGLGLAISYRVVQAHDGDIWAESVPGKGTTFLVKLPR
ncbi:MAG: PAS domain S-box protein [Deltaproteobacteria bacterium]|nr:PAS domain S-box protein [Deltaproteobacteria bacterium]